MNLLEVRNLTIENPKTKERLIKNISFDIKEPTILGVLGESGSGKSLLCKAILGLLDTNLKLSGSIKLENIELINNEKEIRKNFCVVLQEALNAFNPLYTIQFHMLESIKYKKSEALKLCKEKLEKVGLKDTKKILKSYAHELSGGQLQRIMIAIALLQNKKIIIADEPTSSLDSINQKEIINIFKNLNKTLIFVSHDLALISYLANDIIVLKHGEIAEQGDKNNIFYNPKNEYVKSLLDIQNNLSKEFISCLK